MKVLISAAEISSDIHGARLLRALKEFDSSIDAFGIGGAELKAAGLRVVVPAEELLVMGSSEILRRLPRILRALRELIQEAQTERPDVAVVIDYPDFHLSLARRFKRLGIPVVYYIPPKVWAWRRGRIRALRKLFSKLLCIFPFEKDFYRQQGVEVSYVGNPLIEELPLELSRAEARAQLSLLESDLVLALLPGSRPSEVARHLESLLLAAVRTAGQLQERLLFKKLKVLLPFPLSTDLAQIKAQSRAILAQHDSNGLVDFQIFKGRSSACLVAADAALVKSGTSTLEAALLGCPHVLLYRGSWLSELIFFKFIRFRYKGPVGLPNLVMGWKPGQSLIVPEILGNEVTVSRLTAEAVSLLTDDGRRARMKGEFQKLREALTVQRGEGRVSPSRCAAKEILHVAKNFESNPPGKLNFLINHLVSWGWSMASFAMRQAIAYDWVHPRQLDARVISVGNLQAGGAGKTPLVAVIAREAAERKMRVCILTRGYHSRWERSGGIIVPGQKSSEVKVQAAGDEALLLHDLAPEASIAIGADRIQAYETLKKTTGRSFDLILLDDGFQHWKIKKDLEIVALTSAARGDRVFRDWDSALREAHLLIWTKGEARPRVPFEKPLVRLHLSLNPSVIEAMKARPWWLVTGVADTCSVVSLLKRSGISVLRHLSFRDHADYAQKEVFKIIDQAKKAGCGLVLTGKDWVKWRELGVSLDQVQVIEPEFDFKEGPEGQEVFDGKAGRALWLKTLWGN